MATQLFPHSDELDRIEQAVFASLMLYQESAAIVFDTVSPQDFYQTRHQIIASTIQDLSTKGEDHNLTSTVWALRESGKLDQAGGASYLASLIDHPIPSDVALYCKKIAEQSGRRKFIVLSNQLQQRARKIGNNFDVDVVEFAHHEVVNASSRKSIPSCRSFEFSPVDAYPLEPPKFLIKNFIERDALVEIYGDPGDGKTQVVLNIKACIATGHHFHGLEVDHQPVVYVPGEGIGGVRRRLRGWEIENDVSLKEAPFLISNGPTALCDDAAVDLFIKKMEPVAEKYGPPGIITFDTLARNFGPGDENSTGDMTKAIAAADRIRSIYRSTIVLVHHSGISDKHRGRGSSALRGAVDAEYRVSMDKDRIITIDAKKMKDAAFPEPMSFKMNVIPLEIVDNYGNEVKSVALQRVEYEPPAVNTSTKGLGKNQQKAISILADLYERFRQNVCESGRDPNKARVLIENWRAACAEEGISRRAFYKLKESLTDKGAIRIDGVAVFLADDDGVPF